LRSFRSGDKKKYILSSQARALVCQINIEGAIAVIGTNQKKQFNAITLLCEYTLVLESSRAMLFEKHQMSA